MSRPTTLRLGDDEYRELERIAQRRGVSLGSLIRDAVRAHYLSGSRAPGIASLLDYVDKHPHDVEDSLEAIEDRINEAMSDAARR